MQSSSVALRQDSHVLIVSNRGPIEYTAQPDGTWEYQRGVGGMVTALINMGTLVKATWVALAISPGDYQAVATLQRNGWLYPPVEEVKEIHLRYVTIPPEAFQKHYGIMSNRVLWFLQHYLFQILQPPVDDVQMRDAWTQGYVVANQAIASAVVDEMGHSTKRSVVLIHDYFLCLVPFMLRARQPNAFLFHFLHCPWPDVRYWHYLPDYICHSIFRGVLANDILGFQTMLDAQNFLLGVPIVLHDAQIDLARMTATYQGHTTQVRAYPIGTLPELDRHDAGDIASFPELTPLLLARQRQQQVIMRVDRLDPSKQIVVGFAAYEQLLENYPELREQVIFLTLFVPAREALPEYRRYREEVQAAIDRINGQYATETWLPIVAIYGNDRVRALTAMQDYDVLLINSVADGMNLVVKEGIAVNKRDGVVILSRTVGAYQQLHDAVLPVAPHSIEETASTLYTALTMSPADKKRLHDAGRRIVDNSTLQHWLDQQLADILKYSHS
jgi:trehalose 6-phosphate synthase